MFPKLREEGSLFLVFIWWRMGWQLLTFSVELVYLRWSVRELDFESMKILSLESQDSTQNT